MILRPTLLRVLAAAALAVQAMPALAVKHVFLVQNSGWMEPFYTDPDSRYKGLVTELVMAVARPGDPMVLASFNQSLPGAPSPKALLSFKFEEGDARKRVSAALASLELARKPGSSAYADTDLGEAVRQSVVSALGAKPGLVWLITNNRNSPNNDQETARRNREFYQQIHSGEAITRALAFPLQMPVKGKHYEANGLMVYVFAVGAEGARDLKALVNGGAVAKVITEPPARLKPLDQDTVRLVPRKVSEAPGVSFEMGKNGMLLANVSAKAKTPAAKIEWQLENTIYPYTITSATISASSKLAGEERPIELANRGVKSLAPGKSMPLASTMTLPVRQLPGAWSMEAFQSAGSAYVMPGEINVELTRQRLELSEAFRERMATLFPGDPMPEIFTPPRQIDSSAARLPLQVRVHYGVGPLVALIGGGLLLLGGLAAAALAFGRPRKVQLTVEDELRTMHARAGTTQPIFDKAGNKVAQLKTTLFGNQLIDLREGAQVRLGR